MKNSEREKSSEIIEGSLVNKEMEVSNFPTSQVLPVNKLAVQELMNQRVLLSQFVKSQLTEANFSDNRSSNFGEGDYGIIPGTKKRCLLKSGAEKLLRLFGLGVRFTQTDKELDRANNFALYTYKAEVYILKSGITIAECEATANSQEIKYKEKTEWRKNEKGISESRKVETPVCDVINTLQKMAQKRSLIGATLLATGASEYFTQDVLEADIEAQEQMQPVAQEPKQQNQNTDEVAIEAPIHCGRKMMISKYPVKGFDHSPWYCITCKHAIAAQ